MTTPPDGGVLEEATGDLISTKDGGSRRRPRQVSEDGFLVEAAGDLNASTPAHRN